MLLESLKFSFSIVNNAANEKMLLGFFCIFLKLKKKLSSNGYLVRKEFV